MRDLSVGVRSALCLLLLGAACGGKDGTDTDSAETTNTESSGSETTGSTGTTATTGTGSTGTPDTGSTGTPDTGTTGSTGTTEPVTTGSTGASDTELTTGPEECASTCASSEDCVVDEEASTGVGGDSCEEGFHCFVEMDCGCILSSCQADCDPGDPSTCERGTTCDANTGFCV